MKLKNNHTVMSNKRDLKKQINYVCGELFAECVAASLYGAKADVAVVKPLLSSIVSLNQDFLSRVSHPEPGMESKRYYRVLEQDFNRQASDIIDQICNIN